jgi:hypothetical protein
MVRRSKGPAGWLTQNLALTLGVSLLLSELFPSVAHARGFPLFIIISDNPWLMALSAVLIAVWAFAKFRDRE